MSTRLEMTDAFIKVLARSNANQRKLLLRGATNEQLKGLFELCLNIIRGNLPVNNTEFRRLKRYRKTLESLLSRYWLASLQVNSTNNRVCQTNSTHT